MLPAAQESATPHQFTFSGSELFQPDKALQIDSFIQRLIAGQPSKVDNLCVIMSIGWDKSGFPETSKIAEVERAVKRSGCVAVALRTADLLGAVLDRDEVIDLVLEDHGHDIRKIPEKVFKLVQQKSDSTNPS